ncbi:PD-(D/E)XK nuclease family protein [Herbidospora galbida]|uniref:PD-(D/E)XK nuclease family protein n=1 Tax=Herbidospora galbida TaxID=2575442 RepID=UPI0014859185|nr:PD-(D/E)XK nuclease family protein [Herbidospora galbida]
MTRPLVFHQPERTRRTPLEEFALAPVMRALDEAEFGRAVTGKPCHAGHLRWAEAATAAFLGARADEEAARRAAGYPATGPVGHEWVAVHERKEADARGATRYERTAWGRRYTSADGTLRELWLPSFTSAKDKPERVILAAAAVAAFGDAAISGFRKPYRPLTGRDVAPQRVRVISVGCGDGSRKVLADLDVAQVRIGYETIVRAAFAELVDGADRRPGADCAGCEELPLCAAPVRVPGLLGATPSAPRKRRTVSMSDLRAHRDCPARYHLTRVLKIKRLARESEQIRRGRAVDAWLNDRHATPGGCRSLPLPEAVAGLTPEETGTAIRMIAQHRAICPLNDLPAASPVHVQPRLAAYDSDLDSVVVADADLLYADGDGWIWRETKTSGKRPPGHIPLMELYPQVALAVVMMASGVPGGNLRRSLVELELLFADGRMREEFAPSDPATVSQARTIIAGYGIQWAADEVYPARPGRPCRGCEALPWCAPGLAEVGETIDVIS